MTSHYALELALGAKVRIKAFKIDTNTKHYSNLFIWFTSKLQFVTLLVSFYLGLHIFGSA